MSQNSQQEGKQPTKGDMLGLLLLLANAHATCVTIFTRSRFGVEALGVRGLAAFVLMVVYGGLRAPGMFLYLGVWLLALMIQRISTFRLVRQGWRAHSRYAGYPALAMKLPGVSERTAVMLIEPLLCVLVGALIYCTVSEGVGVFVMLSFVSLLFRLALDQEITRKRVQKMRDAELEQRYLADRFRGEVDDF
jgi:hypothetical protein